MLATLAACSREGLLTDNDTTVKLGLELEGFPEIQVDTKAGGEALDESAVNSTVLLIFKNKQERVLYEESTDRAYPLLEVPGKCNLDIFAIVNPSNDFSSVTTYDQMKSMKSLCVCAAHTDLEMVAHLDTVLKSDCNVVLKIQRMTAKFTISSIKYRQRWCSNNTDTHFLDMMWLRDISLTCPYTMDDFSRPVLLDSHTNYWYADYGSVNLYYSRADYNAAIGSHTSTKVNGKTYYEYNKGWTLYCYPNTGTTPTKMSLRVDGDGDDGYCYHFYTFTFPEILPNRNYIINQLYIDNTLFSESSEEEDEYHEIRANIEYDMDIYDASTGILQQNVKRKEVAYVENFN